MGKIKTLELTQAQRSALEKGYRAGSSHAFRVRCQMILLKSEERTSAEIADILGCCEMAVNNWLKRYEVEGIEGLRTKSGRGRKPILDDEKDVAQIKQAVKRSRQRLSQAKAELETALGKRFSQKTLERYIKNMVLAINESDAVPRVARRAVQPSRPSRLRPELCGFIVRIVGTKSEGRTGDSYVG
ncbi:MAG TPA: helix-turn-helix domain-containing protein [Pyrinomonadaceae bacterium]|nr:helix-turn-helix domain-containing protein [Pyrinomonadaceae bacterium]